MVEILVVGGKFDGVRAALLLLSCGERNGNDNNAALAANFVVAGAERKVDGTTVRTFVCGWELRQVAEHGCCHGADVAWFGAWCWCRTVGKRA